MADSPEEKSYLLAPLEGKRVTTARLIPAFTDRQWPCALRLDFEDGSMLSVLVDPPLTVHDGTARRSTHVT